MANNQFIIIFTISILLALSFQIEATTTTTPNTTATSGDHDVATREFDQKAIVVVEGKVYCQTCRNYGSPWSLSGADPIPGARVRVVCKNYKKRVSYYNAFSTDHDGYFYAELDDFRMNHDLLDHPLQACYVKLVSSPMRRCNAVSNVNNGHKGSRLRFENKVLFGRTYDTVIYAAGPMAFRPSDCYPEDTPFN